MYFLLSKIILWQFLSNGIVWYPVGENAHFMVAKFPMTEYSFEIKCDDKNPKTVYKWRKEFKADYAINGGYFDQNNQPVGFVKSDTGIWGDPLDYPALFTLDHKAIDPGTGQDPKPFPASFSIENKPAILKAEEFEPKKSNSAIAGFPLLVWEGKNNFPRETGKKARRTIIASKDQNIYFFVSVQGKETLYESGKALEKFGIEKALNLDGGPSTGFSMENRDIPSLQIPCAILLYEK